MNSSTSPVDIRPDHLEIVQDILRAHLPAGFKVWVYGSRAQWMTKDYSDLDLAVEGAVRLGSKIMFRLQVAFEESRLPYTVDVVDLKAVSSEFKQIVEGQRVPLPSANGQANMDGEWREVTLGELVLNFDSRRIPLSKREREKRRGLFPYYGATGVMDYVDDFLFEGLHLLVAEDGSVERPDGKPFLQLVNGRFWVNNHAHVLKGSTDEDTKFLYYALSTINVSPYISGSVQAKLSQGNLNKILMPYPIGESDRRAIAHVLGTLDDKIELNRRMNETLEGMARALFKSWFVDFEPVRAKMVGRYAGLPAEIAGLFPDRLAGSELGDVPEGWEVRALGECFHLTMGQSPPGSTYNENGEGLPFFQGCTDFGFRYPENRKFCTAPTRIAQPDDTLVSVRAPVGDINMAWERCCIGRGLAALRHKSGSGSFTYHSAWAIQERLRQYEHTGTVFGAINKKQFEVLPVIEPKSPIIDFFGTLALGLDERIRSNVAESRTLAALRDALLPRLVRVGNLT